MIRSMTAFASADTRGPMGALICEVRSVNHRYLEQSLRLPDEFRSFESMMRETVARHLARGKVDVSVRVRSETRADTLEVDRKLLVRLAELHQDMVEQFPGAQVQTTELLRFPGVLRQPEVAPDELQALLHDALAQALATLTATREREGGKLGDMLRERLDAIDAIVRDVRRMMPEIRAALRSRLEARLADLQQPVEPGRLEQELVLQITRSDVDEELDRLETHASEARRVLELDEPVGRRLDFLMQEFNREANTLGSKAVDTRSTQAAMELKVLIEQMREQVQNIE